MNSDSESSDDDEEDEGMNLDSESSEEVPLSQKTKVFYSTVVLPNLQYRGSC